MGSRRLPGPPGLQSWACLPPGPLTAGGGCSGCGLLHGWPPRWQGCECAGSPAAGPRSHRTDLSSVSQLGQLEQLRPVAPPGSALGPWQAEACSSEFISPVAAEFPPWPLRCWQGPGGDTPTVEASGLAVSGQCLLE